MTCLPAKGSNLQIRFVNVDCWAPGCILLHRFHFLFHQTGTDNELVFSKNRFLMFLLIHFRLNLAILPARFCFAIMTSQAYVSIDTRNLVKSLWEKIFHVTKCIYLSFITERLIIEIIKFALKFSWKNMFGSILDHSSHAKWLAIRLKHC